MNMFRAAEILIAAEHALEDEGYEVGNVRTNRSQSVAELPLSLDGERYLLIVKRLP